MQQEFGIYHAHVFLRAGVVAVEKSGAVDNPVDPVGVVRPGGDGILVAQVETAPDDAVTAERRLATVVAGVDARVGKGFEQGATERGTDAAAAAGQQNSGRWLSHGYARTGFSHVRYTPR